MRGASDQMFGALIVGCSLGTYLLAYVLHKMLISFEGRSWVPKFKGVGGIGKTSRKIAPGVLKFKSRPIMGEGSSGAVPVVRDPDGAVVVEMDGIVRRREESPGNGKGWLHVSGGATGGAEAVALRRSSGSLIV